MTTFHPRSTVGSRPASAPHAATGNTGAAADPHIKKPTLKELQCNVGVDYLRGHYRMASHGVHANPKGICFSMTSLFPFDEIVAGASNAGLADAGEGAARALVSVSAALLSLSPSLDHQMPIKAFAKRNYRCPTSGASEVTP